MKAKARLFILIGAMLLAAAAGAAGIAAAACEKPAEREPRELEAMGYILTDAGGNIGVYRAGELILRTDVPLQGLRRGDRELIEAGMEVGTWEELMRILQDVDA